MVYVTYFFIQFSPTFLQLDLVSSLPTIDNTTIDFAVVAGLVARWIFRSTVSGGDVAIVFVVVAISVANFDGIGPKNGAGSGALEKQIILHFQIRFGFC